MVAQFYIIMALNILTLIGYMTVTIIILIRSFLYEKSMVILVQLCLTDLSMLLFVVVNISQINQDTFSIDRKDVGNLTYGMFFVADALFLTQHWVFCSEYLSCATTMKLAFSFQNEVEAAKKQEKIGTLKTRFMQLKILDISVYCSIFVISVLVILTNVNETAILVFFDTYTVIITITLGLSLRKVNQY